MNIYTAKVQRQRKIYGIGKWADRADAIADSRSAFLFDLMKKTSCKNRKGFSLAEAMMATIVLGIAAAAVLLPFTSGAMVRAEGMRRTLAAKLASDLMEEIINSPFDQIVSSYDGYTESQGQVKDASGVVFTDSNYSRFSRNVSCVNVYVPQESGAVDSQFIRATVRVYYNGREIANVSRLLGQYHEISVFWISAIELL